LYFATARACHVHDLFLRFFAFFWLHQFDNDRAAIHLLLEIRTDRRQQIRMPGNLRISASTCRMTFVRAFNT